MEISELKAKIEKQKEINTKLYKQIGTATHEDPRNLKAQPILKQWRKESDKLRSLLKELQEMELVKKEHDRKLKESKTFVNSFGEATKRNVTCSTYEKAQKRISKEILNFIR
ncbi:hypothetical protein [Clostridium felsineum]|uniref:Uncharacterized protein n=1 Tax=Clostridium felsineum TaxID=36839 RepID=A0A1S8MDR0_9CLOT|nr:hypothetical protein [Clostridium felsineum]URZ06452.1 hypothetical protein CLROS_017850 [Clostridium felsineum]URZ11487.1 hypothetical protein CROST_022040 [Clostridium felsineum]